MKVAGYVYGDHQTHKVPAPVAVQELERVRKEFGELAADSIVRAAGRRGSALRPEFEWNDDVAGHEYRMEQARRLLRAIHVVYLGDDGQEHETRWYQVIPDDAKPGLDVYYNVEQILAEPSYRETVVTTARRELIAYRDRYRSIEALYGVHQAIFSNRVVRRFLGRPAKRLGRRTGRGGRSPSRTGKLKKRIQ